MSNLISLRVQDLSVKRGDEIIFAKLDFISNAGDIIAISGANGSGKTSLLRCLCGFIKKHGGYLGFRDEDGSIDDSDSSIWQSNFMYLGHRNPFYTNLTAGENITFWHRFLCNESRSKSDITASLKMLQLENLVNHNVSWLSEGQKKRLALLITDFSTAPIRLLDEPDSCFDNRGLELLTKTLQHYRNKGYITIIASHRSEDLPFSSNIDLSDLVPTTTSGRL